MFAAFASDSEGEEEQKQLAKKEPVKTTKQDKKKEKDTNFKGKVKNEDEHVPWKDLKGEKAPRGRDDRPRGRGRGDRYRGDRYRGRGDRGRYDRGRGRPRGDRYRGRGRGRRNYDEGEGRDDRGPDYVPKEYKEGDGENWGERPRGRYGRRGRGGRFGRGGHRYKYHIEGSYSKAAPRSEVLTDKDREVEEQVQKEIDAQADENQKHWGHDKVSGSGLGKEVKKGGAGKAGWGADEFEDLEHRGAQEASEIMEEGYVNQEDKAKEKTEGEKPADENEDQGEGEDEKEDTTISYAEYLEQRKKASGGLLKTEARSPEEIKMANIEKHTDAKKEKVSGSTIKSHEAYAPTGIKADVELGFGAAPDDEPEETYYDRPPRGGRGRGRRGGRGRGGYNDR